MVTHGVDLGPRNRRLIAHQAGKMGVDALQPGTNALPLTVSVRLPASASVTAAEPAPASSAAGLYSFVLHLDHDQTIDIRFSPGAPSK